MPFRSKAQQRFMFWKHPTIAKRWAKEYGVPKNLPEKVSKKSSKKRKKRKSNLINLALKYAKGEKG